MPKPSDYKDQESFMHACVPRAVSEGREQNQAVAMCSSMWRDHMGGKSDDTLIFQGAEVKALDDSGRVGGYLVRFTTEEDPDLTGDYFSTRTDFGEPDRLPVLYNHGFDAQIGRKRVGLAEIRRDDAGLWAEAQLALRDEYEKQIFELARAGKLGWSSGAAAHTVEREPGQKSSHIKQWFIAEASLTPTPAEPRNAVISIKSLFEGGDPASAQQPEDNDAHNKENEMEANELKELLSGFKAEILDATKATAEEAVKKYADEHQPEVKAGFNVVEDEADKALKGNPFKGGEFFKAVKNAALYPANTDERLLPLKATGLNEAIPSQGGFLVPPEIAAGIMQRMYPVGGLLDRINPISVSGNSLTFNMVDETSRANGSRYGGIQGYWMAEAGTKTSSKPTFMQATLKLKKVAALCYATDELLEDASALESWITTYVPQELKFKAEDAIINGDGVGKPFGILNSTALISATRTDASEIDNMDIGRMWARRWTGVNDYIWLVSASTFPQLISMTIGNMPAYMPPGGLADAPYGRLFGRPVIETEYSPALGTLGDILLFSPSQYLAIHKGGVQAASSIHVQFTTDETAFRFVYRIDGQPAWSAALTPFNAGDTVSPYVALAAST